MKTFKVKSVTNFYDPYNQKERKTNEIFEIKGIHKTEFKKRGLIVDYEEKVKDESNTKPSIRKNKKIYKI